MADRRHGAAFYRALKQDTVFLIDEVGTQKQAAECTRVDQQTLSNYGNKHRGEYMPIDVLADLVSVTRSDHVLRLLADSIGAIVIKLPDAVGPACIVESSGQMAMQLGKAMMVIGQALADGEVTAAEAEAIIPKLQSLILSAYQLIEQFKAEAGR